MRCAIALLFGVCFLSTISASDIEGYKTNCKPISSIQIFGERCSGTNYLQSLINNNFLNVDLNFRYGWKHYPCWQNSAWKKIYSPHFSKYYLDLIDNEDYLFIFIVRNPYDWLQSFYTNPHNVSSRVNRNTFHSFISSEWYTEENETIQWILKNHKASPIGVHSKNDWVCRYFFNPHLHRELSTVFWDINPMKMSSFPNVLALRTARFENFIRIYTKVSNACIIQYEKLRDCPSEVLNQIAEIFGIKKVEEFLPVKGYKGTNIKFVRKKYTLPLESKEYIDAHLNQEVERYFGYDL